MRAQGVQGQGCPQHENTQPGRLTLQDDFPMALLPDPTTAASERSPVKKN